MATMSLNLGSHHYQQHDGCGGSMKKRAVTLARVGGGTPARISTAAADSSPSDFTRIRRMNTLRYVVQRPHPVLKSKSKSISGGITYTKRSSNRKRAQTKKAGSNSNEDETESQEISLLIRSSFSSNSTSSSCEEDQVEDDEQLEKEEKEDGQEEREQCVCDDCHTDIESHESLVMFGERKFHLYCFRCGECNQQMGSIELFLVNLYGAPLCLDCTPTCYTCQLKIRQNHVSVLKKDFHEECLACYQCKRKFTFDTKVYASDGKPCCSKCISPVFNENWSPTKIRSSSFNVSSKAAVSLGGQDGGVKMSSVILSPSPSTDSGVSETISGDGNNDESVRNHQPAKLPDGVVLNPKLESLSRSITLYSSDNQPTIRPSFSEPNLSSVSPATHGLNVSLRSILFDEDGVILFVNYCVNNNVVEFVVFWLDVEHFKHFDGSKEDLKLFAHHIVTKYVGYYAEVPVSLPRDLQRGILDRIEESEVTQELYNESQQYVYSKMEKEILGNFLQSEDGQNYLQLLTDRSLSKMQKQLRVSDDDVSLSVKATITNFDKRRLDTKFYVYEVEVTKGSEKYHIYRRYSEWYSLNQALRKAFPLEKFPPLPKKIFLGRSQKRTVAVQRMRELQVFLQGLLSMSHEIVTSVLLRRFFKQTESDKEDELFNCRIQELQSRRESD